MDRAAWELAPAFRWGFQEAPGAGTSGAFQVGVWTGLAWTRASTLQSKSALPARSTPRAAPDRLRDFGGPSPLPLVPGLRAGPMLIPDPVADLARIAQDGVMLPLRAAARASALGDLLLLPPVLAGRLHLRQPSPTLPILSSVKCTVRRARWTTPPRGTSDRRPPSASLQYYRSAPVPGRSNGRRWWRSGVFQ